MRSQDLQCRQKDAPICAFSSWRPTAQHTLSHFAEKPEPRLWQCIVPVVELVPQEVSNLRHHKAPKAAMMQVS